MSSKIELNNGKLRGWTPVPRFESDEFDFDINDPAIHKALESIMNKLDNIPHTMILTTTPHGNKGFFWDTLHSKS